MRSLPLGETPLAGVGGVCVYLMISGLLRGRGGASLVGTGGPLLWLLETH